MEAKSNCIEEVKYTYNSPSLWKHLLPKADISSNKYSRGHSLVLCGEMIGATKLLSNAARRAGAGIVTIGANTPQFNALEVSEIGTLLKELPKEQSKKIDKWYELASSKKISSICIGSGLGVSLDTVKMIEITFKALQENKATLILDAGALMSFANAPKTLFSLIKNCTSPVIMTPHEGEFNRLFSNVLPKSNYKIELTKLASSASGSFVVHKGNMTVISSPKEEVIINDGANPWLSTAGSGDVLVGIISALINRKEQYILELLAASVYIHNDCANVREAYIIAEDLVDALHSRMLFYLKDSFKS